MSLNVFSEHNDEFTVVKANGDMDFHNFRLLKTSVEQALAAGRRQFILDLSRLDYLDSSALGSLLYNQKLIRDHDGCLVVIPGPALADILALTHLDSYFDLVESVADGRRRLEEAMKTQRPRIKIGGRTERPASAKFLPSQ